MLIAGTFSTNKQTNSAEIAKSIAEKSIRHSGLHAEPIHLFDGLQLYAIKRSADKSYIQYKNDKSLLHWLIGDINYTYPYDHELDDHTDPQGRWLSIQVDSQENSISFTTDILGSLWLYYAKIPDGYAFSNDFGALAKSLPYPLTIDESAVKSELVLTYTPDESTIFEQISVLKPASKTKFSSQGISVERLPAIRSSYNSSTSNVNDRYEELDEIFDHICKKHIQPNPKLVLSLSAGYDSRYALAALKRHNIEMKFCTFGNPKSNEVINSQKVANYLESESHVFDFKTGDWDEWKNSAQTLGNTGMIQWNGWSTRWCQFQRKYGTASVIGYLGDAISGKHLPSNTEKIQDGIDYWMDWSTKGNSLDSPFMKESLKKDIRTQLKEKLSNSIDYIDIEHPYQQALYLDLYGRQRRRVANQANLIERHLTPVLFFYHKSLIEFFFRLPVSELQDQSFYKSYAKSRFPELFCVHDQLKKPELSVRIKNKFASLLNVFESQNNTPHKPNVIDHKNIIFPNSESILNLTHRVEPVIGSIVDLQRLRSYIANPKSSDVSSHQAIQIINLCILAELAL